MSDLVPSYRLRLFRIATGSRDTAQRGRQAGDIELTSRCRIARRTFEQMRLRRDRAGHQEGWGNGARAE